MFLRDFSITDFLHISKYRSIEINIKLVAFYIEIAQANSIIFNFTNLSYIWNTYFV